MLTIDGSRGEGGGQVLRSSLALSLASGTPFRIERIRAGRARPGLMRQHLTALEAAAAVGQATVEGAAIGSREVVFRPGRVRAGEYRFAVGTAGSTTLVLQTVLLPLLLADAPSRLTLEGGTHNPYAPPFDFLAAAFLPLLRRMGARVEARLERAGFYPAGGGRLTVEIGAPGALTQSEHVTEVFTGFGQVGVRAEAVAEQAVQEAQHYLAADVPVGPHLADQLLLPLALAGGGSFRTMPLTRHATTNIAVIGQFLASSVEVSPVADTAVEVAVRA
jgi:RNA 3'-terminal phosphate cyclase (ATP)